MGERIMGKKPEDNAGTDEKNTNDSPGSGEGQSGDGDSGEQNGFPEKTPIKEMTPEQQAAYYKHQLRKTESKLGSSVSKEDYDTLSNELEELRRKNLSDEERASEDALNAAREEGRTAARSELAPQLVRAAIDVALAGRVEPDQVDEHLEYVDLTRFLTDRGEVDTDKVSRFVKGFAPSQENDSSSTRDLGRGWNTYSSGQDRDAPRGGVTSVEAAMAARREELSKNR